MVSCRCLDTTQYWKYDTCARTSFNVEASYTCERVRMMTCVHTIYKYVDTQWGTHSRFFLFTSSGKTFVFFSWEETLINKVQYYFVLWTVCEGLIVSTGHKRTIFCLWRTVWWRLRSPRCEILTYRLQNTVVSLKLSELYIQSSYSYDHLWCTYNYIIICIIIHIPTAVYVEYIAFYTVAISC